ncbi:MAG: hypothetical protein KDK26_14030 [Roseivivax sp.]|nr:hypothetical protein [Roseivivax sp.]
MTQLKDFETPAQLFKSWLGQPKVESYKDLLKKLESIETDINRDAKALYQLTYRGSPDVSKLQSEFDGLLKAFKVSADNARDLVSRLQTYADALTNEAKFFDQQIKRGIDDANAIENMYETLEKAIKKAEKSKSPRDAQAAEIAGKAYQKACRNSEKNLKELSRVSKSMQDAITEGAKAAKEDYFGAVKAMNKVAEGVAKFAKDHERELWDLGRDLNILSAGVKNNR